MGREGQDTTCRAYPQPYFVAVTGPNRPDQQFIPAISRLDATALVIGSMIGARISPEVFVGATVNLPSGPISVGLSPQRLLAVLSIVGLTWVNLRGVKTATAIQNALTAIKVATLLALTGLGLTIGRQAEAVAA